MRTHGLESVLQERSDQMVKAVNALKLVTSKTTIHDYSGALEQLNRSADVIKALPEGVGVFASTETNATTKTSVGTKIK